MTASFLYSCDREVPLMGRAVDLVKRRAVLLSWLLLNSSTTEDKSAEAMGVAPTSDVNLLPMMGILAAVPPVLKRMRIVGGCEERDDG